MTCEEAQGLIQVLKKIMGMNAFSIPKQGCKDVINLVSVFSNSDRFKVDFNRSSTIKRDKYNPDGTIVPCPHIHIQTHEEGKWDDWAYSLPVVFGNVQDRIDNGLINSSLQRRPILL